jgi:hypothetical protein
MGWPIVSVWSVGLVCFIGLVFPVGLACSSGLIGLGIGFFNIDFFFDFLLWQQSKVT